MTKVKTAVSAALVAAAMLGAVPAANAAGANPSDLIVAVWDSSTNTSYVVDLGVPYANLTSASTFENPGGFTESWTIDTSSTQLTTDLGGAANEFMVFAVQNTPTAGHTVQGQALLFGDNGGSNPNITSTILHNNITINTAGWFATNMSSVTSLLGSGSGSAAYWGSCTANSPGCSLSPFTTANMAGIGEAAPGTALTFEQILATNDGAKGSTPPTFTPIGNAAGAGVFTFSGDTLTYTLAAAPAVPLPAAGWLVVSGLLGLVGIGRRRLGAAQA
jgi:hypothetical protein